MDTQKAIELNRKIIRIVTIIGIILTIILGWLVAKNDYFALDGPFRESIAHSGWVGILIFILIQITQVVYPIIPGGLTCVIGHIVFGPLHGWIYNFVGIMIGSCINFWLARRYGETLAKAFVDDDTYNKYIGYLDKGKHFERIFFWALVLPGFPDDFLCMVAGLSHMTFKKFVTICLIAKPVTLYVYTLIAAEGVEAFFRFIN